MSGVEALRRWRGTEGRGPLCSITLALALLKAVWTWALWPCRRLLVLYRKHEEEMDRVI